MKNFFPILSLLSLSASLPLMAAGMDKAELDCLVRPEMYIELSSPVDSTLTKMLVQAGDSIRQGQPLVRLESSVESSKVKLAEMEAGSSLEIENRKVQLKYAKRNLKRQKELYTKHSVSQFEKDKAETEVELAELELLKARHNKWMSQLNLEKAKTELALRTIKSPINGIVIDIYAHVGESVADRSIMKLAKIDPLRIELIAPTEYFGHIDKGMQVDILPERPANKIFKAKVTMVDQLIDPASGSFTVRMALPNPGDELVGGVNCIARFDFQAPMANARSTSFLQR